MGLRKTLRETFLKTKIKLFFTEKEFDEWGKRQRIFFILAIGRSGTKFLANLLNKAPGALVVYEPVEREVRAYQVAFHSQEKSKVYIHSFRRKEIYLRVCDKEIVTYGEVNSVLRRHVAALRDAFPNAKFMHLIRDGRDVIRSAIARKTMTVEDSNTRDIYPREGDPWKPKWSAMSRFERLCWYWQTENCYLRTSIGKAVKFEEIISSYDYFQTRLLDPLGLDISEEIWRNAVTSPVNKTQSHKIPYWSEWDDETISIFEKICGKEMEANGYLL